MGNQKLTPKENPILLSQDKRKVLSEPIPETYAVHPSPPCGRRPYFICGIHSAEIGKKKFGTSEPKPP